LWENRTGLLAQYCVETVFRKMARLMLRGIRVASKQELIGRIQIYFTEVNADPVSFRWKYKTDEAAILYHQQNGHLLPR